MIPLSWDIFKTYFKRLKTITQVSKHINGEITNHNFSRVLAFYNYRVPSNVGSTVNWLVHFPNEDVRKGESNCCSLSSARLLCSRAASIIWNVMRIIWWDLGDAWNETGAERWLSQSDTWLTARKSLSVQTTLKPNKPSFVGGLTVISCFRFLIFQKTYFIPPKLPQTVLLR